jgi:hypothetical protein
VERPQRSARTNDVEVVMPADVALACRDEELGRVNLARLVQVPLYPIQGCRI